MTPLNGKENHFLNAVYYPFKKIMLKKNGICVLTLKNPAHLKQKERKMRLDLRR